MADRRERRSSAAGLAAAIADQVGDRRPRARRRPGGGGYQGNRTTPTSHLGADPRLAELERMGLGAAWLRIATEIGVDAFHRMWKILDEEFPPEVQGQGLRIWLRPYRSYLRYQRNRFIEELHAQGCSEAEIRERVKRELREEISIRHISRICQRG